MIYCSPHAPSGSGLAKAHDILYAFSFSIIVFMAAEMAVHIIAAGRLFFHSSIHVIEFVVIYTSVILETTFSLLNNAVGQEVASFLILVRLWRLLAVVESGSDLVYNRTVYALKQKVKDLEKQNRALEEKLQ